MSEPTVQVQCPACQATVAIPQSWLDKRRPCPQCHGWVSFPPRALADDAAPATLMSAPPPDPYGNTVLSRPGVTTGSVPPNANTTAAPLTFEERLKQVAAQTQTGAPATGAPTSRPAPDSGSDWSPGARTPPVLPATGGGKIQYGRDTVGESAAKRRQLRDEGQKQGSEWDDEGGKDDWSRRSKERDPQSGRPDRHGRRAESTPQGQSILSVLGLGAAILSLVMCAIICVGVIGMAQAAGGGAGGGPPVVWTMVVGCAALLTPALNLIGAILSGIALAQARDKKTLPIVGLAINGILLLAVLGLLCLGMING